VAQLVGVTDQADRRHLTILRHLDRFGDLGLVRRPHMRTAEVEQQPHRLRLVGAAATRAGADGLAEGGRGRQQGAGGEQQAELGHVRSPLRAISTKGRRSLPKNVMSPTKLVGAPKTPRATASSVVAFSRSLTSWSWMRLPIL